MVERKQDSERAPEPAGEAAEAEVGRQRGPGPKAAHEAAALAAERRMAAGPRLEPFGVVAPEHAEAAGGAEGAAIAPVAADEGQVAAEPGRKGAPDEPGAEAKNQVGGSGAQGGPQATPTVKLGGGAYKIATPGEGLWVIAHKVYGSGTYWNKIREANPGKVHGPKHIILLGDTLTLPLIERPVPELTKDLQKNATTLADLASRSPAALRDLVRGMSDGDYQAFIQGFAGKQREKNAHLIQQVEMMRATGLTPDEMAEDQKKYLEAEAAKKGVSVGDYVKELVAKKGYGGGTADHWNKLTADEKKAWGERFAKVVKRIEASAPPDVKEIVQTARARGGGFVWSPEEIEKNGAFAFTAGDWKLYCGTRFVEAAEADVARVYANISHEMGGHNFYGDEFGHEIQGAALDKLPPGEKAKALSGGNSLYSAYGYMESEVFAELYEYKYDSEHNPTDHPFDTDPKGKDLNKPGGKPPVNDVARQLQRIKDAFSPTVAKGLVAGLSRRVELDPRIVEGAKVRYREAAQKIFGP